MKKFGTFISIAAIAFLLYIFTFYIEGEMGIVLIAFLIIPPVISFLLAFGARKRITVSISSEAYVKKGSELEVTVTVEKSGKLPIAVAEICTASSEVFEKQNKKYRLSLLTERKSVFTYKIKALTGGNGEISVKNLYSCDFLGFIRFKVRTDLPEPVSVGVIPEIPDVKTSSQLFRQVADSVLTSDDDDENDTELMYSSNSMPGYEHREYIQGDPLKRINWKLSSKKRKLMVRLDEAVSMVRPLVVFDLYRSSGADAEKAVLKEEKLICAVIGLLKSLVKHGISCNFIYNSAEGAVMESIDNIDYPDVLLLKILAVKVIPDRRIETETQGSVCSCIAATTVPDGSFSGILKSVEGASEKSIIIPERAEYKAFSELWYLDETDNMFKLV
ncbi:MAG: DUF58 domain-containing protein [Ruminococcus sp.]|nr:DUF58 domain-containing protein [Ruminococcus sp.]